MGWTAFSTPLGWIALGWSSRGITALRLLESAPEPQADAPPPFVDEARAAVEAFLGGASATLGPLSLDLSGLPPFQRRCLEVLRSTRPGETLTYSELAARAGSPRAARAVGQAMRRNPLPILVPCHRVVGERWSGGYSFGQGLATKRRLLDLERP